MRRRIVIKYETILGMQDALYRTTKRSDLTPVGLLTNLQIYPNKIHSTRKLWCHACGLIHPARSPCTNEQAKRILICIMGQVTLWEPKIVRIDE